MVILYKDMNKSMNSNKQSKDLGKLIKDTWVQIKEATNPEKKPEKR